MIPELGHFLLWLALGLALVLGTVPLVGAARERADWMAVARPAALWQFVLVIGAFACLMTSFVQNDFSVLNVATNSNSALPVQLTAPPWQTLCPACVAVAQSPSGAP